MIMSENLKDRVREGSETGRAVRPGNGRRNGAAATTAPATAPAAPAPPPEPMPDPDEIPVVLALIRAMRDVTAVRKDGYHDAPGAKFNFRGIDAVLNAVGPAFRRHGIIVMPKLISKDFRDVQTSGGKPAHEIQTTVQYSFYGPQGDFIVAEVPGEAMDSADKGVSKAMSVAYRIALIQALSLPTDEPDPDSYHYERDVPPADPADVARGELIAGMRERNLDAEAVLAAFGRRTGEDVRTTTDVGAIYAFTSELFADPMTVLAVPGAEPQDPSPADESQDGDTDGTPTEGQAGQDQPE